MVMEIARLPVLLDSLLTLRECIYFVRFIDVSVLNKKKYLVVIFRDIRLYGFFLQRFLCQTANSDLTQTGRCVDRRVLADLLFLEMKFFRNGFSQTNRYRDV